MAENIEKEVGFWEIAAIFIKWRRLLAISFIAAAILTLVVSILFLPNWYSSTALLFPPQQESGGLGLSSLLSGGLSGLLSGGSRMALPTFATPSDIYAAVLKSRTVAEGVIAKHDLIKIYGTKTIEKTIMEFSGHLGVKVEPNGMINLSIEDKDPERAAAIAQTLVKELNRVNSESGAAQASATRKFVEERLTQSKMDLADAENAYRDFQQKNRAIALDEQMRAVIGSLAELKGQQVLAEIELGVLRRTFLPGNTGIRQQEAKIDEIKKQINILEEGSPDSIKEALSIPMSAAPNLGLELARLTRDLKIQETIFELLTQQFEQAKIQEKKDTPTIQTLDAPTVPEKKSRPKRTILALMAGILSMLLSTAAIFGKEFVDRQKQADTETYRQLEKITGVFREDLYFVRSIFMSKRHRSGDSQH
jgi:tyrosine-protein kinase Etk/Wzc